MVGVYLPLVFREDKGMDMKMEIARFLRGYTGTTRRIQR